MGKKILVTGSKGMLATDMARAADAGGYQVIGLSHSDLDVTQAHWVREALERVKRIRP